MKYVKAYDGLRGVGAVMILLYHWPGRITISHGWEFMQMFFVMSGYLITLSLLEEKQKYSFGKFAIRFYIKRAFRLFPLYYAYLLGALCLYYFTKNSEVQMAEDVAKHGWYLFTYTFNYMSVINFFMGWDYGAKLWSTHLWTLSMEEQFYLVFPFIVFFISFKNLQKLVIGSIIIAVIFRVVSYQYYIYVNPNDKAWIVQNLVRIPFAQMDSFAFGAVMAIFPLKFVKNIKRWFVILSCLIVVLYLANMAYVYLFQGESYFSLTYGKKIAEGWLANNYLFAYMIVLVNFWCALLIKLVKENRSIAKKFEVRPMVFLGKLSYGFYLLHLPILHLFLLAIYKLNLLKVLKSNLLIESFLLLLYLTITIVIAYSVNTWFEAYFLQLKNKIFNQQREISA
ncbi:MAG: acyltransferase [Chitinophagales bacterium]|nr:acyltransferase [Chitinophagales bacterium]